jgi:hypothetical protein
MSKIIEKYEFTVEDKYGNNVRVFARIEKEKNLYYWYVSHLTKPQDADGVGLYYASNTESTFESAKAFLNSYIATMKRFKVLVPNNNY